MVSFNNAATTLILLASTTLSGASFTRIAGYEPGSQVTDHAAIDLDQAALEEQLALQTDASFDNALKIYTNGGNSKSVAQVNLSTPLPGDVVKGTQILGVNAAGNQIVGKAYEDNASGATTLLVQYATSDDQKNYVGCQVGALVSPNTEGCFVANGNLSIDGVGDVTYAYDINTGNINKRTISGFSTSAQSKMYECKNCPYNMYEKFFNYYGSFDYANQIVLAAFAGQQTNFKNFNNNFGLYSFEGREQIVKKGTAYMVTLMYAIREMEDALDDCKEACTIENCNDDPVHAWDEAVAFYTGSLEGEDGSGSGKLSYALADKRCSNFATCGDLADSITGTAAVNVQMFEQFTIGKSKIAQGQCESAREQKNKIEKLMLVPLIQGTLRYAWKTANEAYSEKAEAEGVIFAASVLPAVAACDGAAAKTIADNLVAGNQGTANFAKVKAAFESTYACMGVEPKMIGGLYNAATGGYYSGTEPLGYSAGASMTTFAAFCVGAATSLFLFL